jgi:16S rRNA (uracil1498-N3)-methyltransferase
VKRFYSTNIQNNFILLEEEEAQHCTKVLRCKIGDTVEVLNGSGSLLEGKISIIQKHEVQIEISKILKEEKENTNQLSIAICLTKNPARLEWFIEKATEIGISNIYPMVSERTEKEKIKQERLQQIVISAAKQSGQLFFPILHSIQKFSELINSTNNQYNQYFIAHCENQKQHLKNLYQKKESALLLIGPEGDFTPTEIQQAINKNYTPISLGNSILRVETAGVVACSIVSIINAE